MATRQESETLARYWQEQISLWEQSGQSRISFCQQHDLNYHRFGYWYQKFQLQEKSSSATASADFVPVRLQQSVACPGLSIELPGGLTLRGISRENLSLVEQLLSRLS